MLPPERHLTYTLRTIGLATWISRHWTAAQALDTYASLVWMGDDRVGVREGAMFLFGKSLDRVTCAETALLMVTIRSPTMFSATCHPDKALKARNRFLERMHHAGLVDASTLREAIAAPLGVAGSCNGRGASTWPGEVVVKLTSGPVQVGAAFGG